MPRTSEAALSIVRTALTQERPRPPAELTEDEAMEWREVVGRLPTDWFPRETHQLLINYCRHVVQRRVIQGMIKEHLRDADGDMYKYDKLLSMAERETRAINCLARALRMTNQSRWQPRTADRKASGSNSSDWGAVA